MHIPLGREQSRVMASVTGAAVVDRLQKFIKKAVASVTRLPASELYLYSYKSS